MCLFHLKLISRDLRYKPSQMKRINRKHLLIDLIVFTIFFFICLLFYSHFDPNEMRSNAIFPWDSGVYRGLADSLFSDNPNKIEAIDPFGPRILFPYIYGNIARITGLSFIDSAYFLNLFSTYLVTIFSLIFWRFYGTGRLLSLIGIGLFTLFWAGPLRGSGFYPGSGFAFESLIVVCLFMILSQFSKKNIWFIFILSIFIFLLTCGREFVSYLLIMVLLVKYSLKKWLIPKLNNETSLNTLVFKIHEGLQNKSYLNLLIGLSFSLGGYFFSRSLVHDPNASYFILKEIVQYGWFHIHVGELLYPYFYALGPFFLCFLLVIAFKKSRDLFVGRLNKSNQHLDLILIFIAASVIFSIIGGSDSDRFILWFFPFFGLLGLKSIEVMLVFKDKGMKISLVLVFVVGLLWTRFYVPAFSHVFFPGDSYRAYGGIKTNYDPDLFYGPSFMEKYRVELKEVPYEDIYSDSIVRDKISDHIEKLPKVPLALKKESDKQSPYKGVYKYEINNIPFPLGFAHNQYEILAAHPYHGDKRIRFLILIQWVTIFGILILLNRFILRTKL